MNEECPHFQLARACSQGTLNATMDKYPAPRCIREIKRERERERERDGGKSEKEGERKRELCRIAI